MTLAATKASTDMLARKLKLETPERKFVPISPLDISLRTDLYCNVSLGIEGKQR
jgi:hypothetical protein